VASLKKSVRGNFWARTSLMDYAKKITELLPSKDVLKNTNLLYKNGHIFLVVILNERRQFSMGNKMVQM